MEKRNTKLKALIIGIACMIILWLIIMFSCKLYTNKKIDAIINASLEEAISQRSSVLINNLEKEYEILNSFAAKLSRLEIDLEEAELFLDEILSPLGKTSYWLKLKNTQIDSTSYKSIALEASLSGEISEPIYVEAEGKRLLSLYVPVKKDGAIIAVLGRTFEAHEFNSMLLPCSNLNEGICLVINNNGAVISASPEAEAWLNNNPEFSNSEGKFIERLRPKETGAQLLNILGEEYHITHRGLDVGGFELLCINEASAERKPYEFVSATFIMHSLLTLIGYIALVSWLAYFWSKQGRLIKAEKERLEWVEERYRIVASESDDVIFEISLKDKAFVANENFHKLFGYCLLHWDEEQIREMVYSDDVENFREMLKAVREDARLIKDNLRIRGAEGSYIWCHVLVATLKDEKGKPMRVLGKITDIDVQMQETEWLRRKAQQDSLTQLYNKQTTHNLIQRFITREGKDGVHGLIIVDVDDLKIINDTYGHLYGDAVLTGLAGKMRELFRSTDIVGRIGGDEFLVFLKNVNSRAQLKVQAEELLFAINNAPKDINYSCSAGAALYPEDGETVDWLFSNADSALYKSKRFGKNRFRMHGEG